MARSRKDRISRIISQINTVLYDAGAIITWEGPASESRIAKAEKMLGCQFPFSYREFLTQVGGCGLENFPISGIPRIGALENGGSVVGMSSYWREDWVPEPLPEYLLVIQHDEDDNEPFCLDTSQMKRAECPVVLYYPVSGKCEHIAKDFVSFLEDRIGFYVQKAAEQTDEERAAAIEHRTHLDEMIKKLKARNERR